MLSPTERGDPSIPDAAETGPIGRFKTAHRKRRSRSPVLCDSTASEVPQSGQPLRSLRGILCSTCSRHQAGAVVNWRDPRRPIRPHQPTYVLLPATFCPPTCPVLAARQCVPCGRHCRWYSHATRGGRRRAGACRAGRADQGTDGRTHRTAGRTWPPRADSRPDAKRHPVRVRRTARS